MGFFSRSRPGSGTARSQNLRTEVIAPRLLSYQAANLQEQGTRQRQEDSFAFANAMDVTEIKNNGLLALLADGMGGLEDGKLVSETAIQILLTDFQGMDRKEDMGMQLRDSVYRTNASLYEQFRERGGTTLIACIFFREMLYFASVGDSYLYLKRGNSICRLNHEHTYRQQLYLRAIEEGMLDPLPADMDPDRACLSEFMGKRTLGEIDSLLKPMPLQEGDVLLLCSDGVGGILTETTLFGCLSEPSPILSCRQILQEIQAQGCTYQDNYTALVIACGY